MPCQGWDWDGVVLGGGRGDVADTPGSEITAVCFGFPDVFGFVCSKEANSNTNTCLFAFSKEIG